MSSFVFLLFVSLYLAASMTTETSARRKMLVGLITSSPVSVPVEPTNATSTIVLSTVSRLQLLPKFDLLAFTLATLRCPFSPGLVFTPPSYLYDVLTPQVKAMPSLAQTGCWLAAQLSVMMILNRWTHRIPWSCCCHPKSSCTVVFPKISSVLTAQGSTICDLACSFYFCII